MIAMGVSSNRWQKDFVHFTITLNLSVTSSWYEFCWACMFWARDHIQIGWPLWNVLNPTNTSLYAWRQEWKDATKAWSNCQQLHNPHTRKWCALGMYGREWWRDDVCLIRAEQSKMNRKASSFIIKKLPRYCPRVKSIHSALKNKGCLGQQRQRLILSQSINLLSTLQMVNKLFHLQVANLTIVQCFFIAFLWKKKSYNAYLTHPKGLHSSSKVDC